MRLRPATLIVVIAAAVVVALSGLSPIPAAHPSPSPSREVASFTCCRQADVDTVRHPGETFAIHWIRVTQRVPADRTPASYELHAALSGAYPNVPDLKASAAASPRAIATAAPVFVTGTATTAPLSVITIPPTAAAGFYDLTTTVSVQGGATMSGASIIRVAAN